MLKHNYLTQISSIPKVIIIVLNWNGLDDTLECLESLININYSNYEILVVDNGSDLNEYNILLKKYIDKIHFIRNNKNYFFSEGNNIGIRYVIKKFNPDYVMLLNNDVIVENNFLIELIKVAEEDCSIGILSPFIYWYEKPTYIQGGGEKIRWFRIFSEKLWTTNNTRENKENKKKIFSDMVMVLVLLLKNVL